MTSLVRRSRRSSPAAVKMSARGVPFWCLNWMKSGKLVNPGQVSSEGVPRAWKVLLSWSRSDSPGRNGTLKRNFIE